MSGHEHIDAARERLEAEQRALEEARLEHRLRAAEMEANRARRAARGDAHSDGEGEEAQKPQRAHEIMRNFFRSNRRPPIPPPEAHPQPQPPLRHVQFPAPRKQPPPSVGGGAQGIVGEFWRCPQCTVANESILVQCLVCNAQRPPMVELHGDAQGGGGGGGRARAAPGGKFVCGVCTYVNSDPDAPSCEMCGTAREMAGAGGGGESKEDEEARAGGGGGQFVMGQEPPPPLKREPLVREHMTFLAGIEEAFGTIHIAPTLLQGVERLVRRPFETLLKQYGSSAAAAAPAASSGSASAVSSPAKAAASSSSSSNGPAISGELLDALLKTLVYRAAAQALRVQKSLELLVSCCLEEEEELRALHCNMCGAAGSDTVLHFSECGEGSQHAFCLTCTHTYVMELVDSKRCGKILCPFILHKPNNGGVDSNGSSAVGACCGDHDEGSVLSLIPGGPSSSSGAGVAGSVLRCDREVDTKFIRRCLSAREFQLYLDECFSLMLADGGGGGGGLPGAPGSGANYVRCPNARCNSIMEVAKPHGLVVPILIKEVDESGKPLSPEAWLHFSEFRVRCHACQANFCSSCKVTPYHMGRSCVEHASYQQAAHCRFCSEQLTPENTDASNAIPAFATICTAETCLQRREHACTEMLPCGHPCPGVRGEKQHAPCLLDECPQRDPKLTVCASDLCSICWTEELGLAPVVQLTSCGHIFHAHCVVDKIAKRWPGVRITFGFLGCSLCKEPMDHPYAPIQAVKLPIDHLWTQVRAKALARLTIEKMEKDQKLIDPQSQFYNKPEAYAMASFAYYNCFKCKKFYFGGRRDCEQNAAAEVRPEDEFVCYDCADLKSIKCRNKEHAEFQVWKCRFCCNLASWFCFGTTHYCEPCHRDNPMEKVKRKREGFKQCPGMQFCPTKMPHAPNGAEAECEFCVGCGACAEELSKLQQAKEKDKQIDKLIDEKLNIGQAAGSSAAAASPAKAK